MNAVRDSFTRFVLPAISRRCAKQGVLGPRIGLVNVAASFISETLPKQATTGFKAPHFPSEDPDSSRYKSKYGILGLWACGVVWAASSTRVVHCAPIQSNTGPDTGVNPAFLSAWNEAVESSSRVDRPEVDSQPTFGAPFPLVTGAAPLTSNGCVIIHLSHLL
jgi:hypothetical protein